MHMKSSRYIVPTEFSDIMIMQVIASEEVGKRCTSDELRKMIRPEFFDVSRDEIIAKMQFLESKMMRCNPEFLMVLDTVPEVTTPLQRRSDFCGLG